MFDLIRSIFAAAPAERTHYAIMSAPRLTDTCEIPYHPELIEELRADHARLTEQFRSIVASFRDGNQSGCLARLEALDRDLRNHLIKEGVRFEAYMSYALESNHKALQLMRKLRVRMRELARYIHEVVELHRAGMLPEKGYEHFGRDLERLVNAFALCLLTQREQLFPLYQPMDASREAA